MRITYLVTANGTQDPNSYIYDSNERYEFIDISMARQHAVRFSRQYGWAEIYVWTPDTTPYGYQLQRRYETGFAVPLSKTRAANA